MGRSWLLEPERRLSEQLELWTQGLKRGPELKQWRLGREQGRALGLELRKQLETKLV